MNTTNQPKPIDPATDQLPYERVKHKLEGHRCSPSPRREHLQLAARDLTSHLFQRGESGAGAQLSDRCSQDLRARPCALEQELVEAKVKKIRAQGEAAEALSAAAATCFIGKPAPKREETLPLADRRAYDHVLHEIVHGEIYLKRAQPFSDGLALCSASVPSEDRSPYERHCRNGEFLARFPQVMETDTHPEGAKSH